MERSNKKPKQKPCRSDHGSKMSFTQKQLPGETKSLSTHTDLTGKVNVANDVLQLEEISNENMLNYLHAREKGEQIKLKIANVTMKEKDLNDEVSNKTIDEIKILIFKKIDRLGEEKQELFEDIFAKTVKNKNKSKYIDYYNELCEQSVAEAEDEDEEV